MQTCPPSEFASRWPGTLRPIVFPVPTPRLPDNSFRILHEFGLPREVTIYCYNDITLTFSGGVAPLDQIWERDLNKGHKMGEMPNEWNRFWHLGDQEYLQGGGWICIEELTGRLVVIDLDLGDGDTVYLLNSSVHRFYTTLAYFLDWSERTDGDPSETSKLRDALRGQSCIPIEELEPFWMNFIDATLDRDPTYLTVTLRSDPRWRHS